MKPSTAYKISNLFYNQDRELDDSFWRDIDQVFDDQTELIKSVDLYLTKLSRKQHHEFPGNLWYQLADIADQAKRTRLTQKQIRFVVMSLIAYWDQTDLEFL
jgi:hypothetical protein